MPADAAKKRAGLTLWLPAVWIAVVLLSAATAGWWKVPAFDRMDWDNLSAVPGTHSMNAVMQNADETADNRYVYWLGTDTMGRDIVSRLAHGARISLAVGVFAPLIGIVLGGILGCLSGYFRGRLESFIIAAMDVILAFPGLVMLFGDYLLLWLQSAKPDYFSGLSDDPGVLPCRPGKNADIEGTRVRRGRPAERCRASGDFMA